MPDRKSTRCEKLGGLAPFCTYAFFVRSHFSWLKQLKHVVGWTLTYPSNFSSAPKSHIGTSENWALLTDTFFRFATVGCQYSYNQQQSGWEKQPKHKSNQQLQKMFFACLMFATWSSLMSLDVCAWADYLSMTRVKETCKVSAALCPHSNLGLGETPLSHDGFPIVEREAALFTSQAFHGNLGADFHIQFSMRDHASDCTAGVCRAMSPCIWIL